MRRMALLLAAAALLSAVPAGAHGQIYGVTCQSRDGRQHFCRADTRGGVYLHRQLSDAPCREGRTWWAVPDGVYVTGGCRAQFELGRSRDSYSRGGYGSYGGRNGSGYGGRYGGTYGGGHGGRYGGYGRYDDAWSRGASGVCRRAVAGRMGTWESNVSLWTRSQGRSKVEFGWSADRYGSGRCSVDSRGRVSVHVDHRGRERYDDQRRHGYHG